MLTERESSRCVAQSVYNLASYHTHIRFVLELETKIPGSGEPWMVTMCERSYLQFCFHALQHLHVCTILNRFQYSNLFENLLTLVTFSASSKLLQAYFFI